MNKLEQKQSTRNIPYNRPVILKALPILALSFVSLTVCANEFDQRQAVNLNEEHKAQLLSNMRGAFSATQSIIKALATDDMQAVADYARPLGFKAKKQKTPDALHNQLPKSFKMLGKAMHQDFDKIADDAENLKDPKHTLQQLAEVFNSCQGCHETFRIESIAVAEETEQSFFGKMFTSE